MVVRKYDPVRQNDYVGLRHWSFYQETTRSIVRGGIIASRSLLHPFDVLLLDALMRLDGPRAIAEVTCP